MGFFRRWVQVTLEKNPTFPLSALLLLVGLRLLVQDGTLDAASAARTAGGAGIVQAYEALLLGLALCVLWPRRIVYETTSALRVFAVVRYAAPFIVIGHAAEGRTDSALLLGGGLAALMIAQTRAIERRLGLDLRRWERLLDAALYTLACVAFPPLASGLATWTGRSLTQAGARWLELGIVWALALALAPLALGLPDLGRGGPLLSRRPAAVWRGLAAVGVPALLFNALWLGGEAPTPFAVLPVALVAVAVFAAIVRAAGVACRFVAHAPALALAAVLVLPADVLLGHLALGRPAALLLFAPVAAAALPLVARADWRRGLGSLALVTALAPLPALGTLHGIEVYALLVLGAATAVALTRGDDRQVARGALAVALVGAHLAVTDLGLPATAAPLATGAVLAGLLAWRRPEAREAVLAAAGLCLVPGAVELVRGPSAPLLLALTVAAGGGLGLLGVRRGDRLLVGAAGALPALVLGRRVADGIDPGVALVLLAFAGLPVGTALALRRERARAARAAVDVPEVLDELEVLEDEVVSAPAEVAA
jgi:hypothetical protein